MSVVPSTGYRGDPEHSVHFLSPMLFTAVLCSFSSMNEDTYETDRQMGRYIDKWWKDR